MNLRSVWKVPVYCAAAGCVSFYLLAHLGRFLYVVQTVGEDGSVYGAVDPVRSAIVTVVLFLAVILLGGLWFFRSITKAEIALSAGITSALYLLLVLVQLFLPPTMNSLLSISISIFQNFVSFPTSILLKLTGRLPLSAILGSFAPLLFIPFGRRKEEIL